MGHYLFEQVLIHLPFDRFIAVSHFTEDRLPRHTVLFSIGSARIAMRIMMALE